MRLRALHAATPDPVRALGALSLLTLALLSFVAYSVGSLIADREARTAEMYHEVSRAAEEARGFLDHDPRGQRREAYAQIAEVADRLARLEELIEELHEASLP